MNRHILTRYIGERYAVSPDFPWAKYPNYAVFRHRSQRKWFALIMEVPAATLGLEGGSADTVEIINLKARPEWIGQLRLSTGILPAYHMNKEHWISVVLRKVDDGTLKQLLHESFDLTAK